jgi:hypothetical protein
MKSMSPEWRWNGCEAAAKSPGLLFCGDMFMIAP